MTARKSTVAKEGEEREGQEGWVSGTDQTPEEIERDRVNRQYQSARDALRIQLRNFRGMIGPSLGIASSSHKIDEHRAAFVVVITGSNNVVLATGSVSYVCDSRSYVSGPNEVDHLEYAEDRAMSRALECLGFFEDGTVSFSTAIAGLEQSPPESNRVPILEDALAAGDGILEAMRAGERLPEERKADEDVSAFGTILPLNAAFSMAKSEKDIETQWKRHSEAAEKRGRSFVSRAGKLINAHRKRLSGERDSDWMHKFVNELAAEEAKEMGE